MFVTTQLRAPFSSIVWIHTLRNNMQFLNDKWWQIKIGKTVHTWTFDINNVYLWACYVYFKAWLSIVK